jgi:hypothetical protein
MNENIGVGTNRATIHAEEEGTDSEICLEDPVNYRRDPAEPTKKNRKVQHVWMS